MLKVNVDLDLHINYTNLIGLLQLIISYIMIFSNHFPNLAIVLNISGVLMILGRSVVKILFERITANVNVGITK